MQAWYGVVDWLTGHSFGGFLGSKNMISDMIRFLLREIIDL
jgi:hypothetical protein